MIAIQTNRRLFALASVAMLAACGQSEPTNAAAADPLQAHGPIPAVSPTPQAPVSAVERDSLYPFYMPMTGLHRPAVKLFVKCDASRAAGHEVYQGRDAASLYGRAEGGYEFTYEALDGNGQPCVYPFPPFQPAIAGDLNGTQYIYRSSIPGQRVTFRSNDPWATIDFRAFDIGRARVHFEMRDIALDFPGAVQAMGALHFEAFGGAAPGLFTAVIRRSSFFGGKNAIFLPSGQTMLYIEDSEVTGNIGTNTDQEHGTYINGTLVTHIRNSSWHGQRGWEDQASGHQLKDKAYLRIYENLTVSNAPGVTVPSAMPLIDASAYGFTWANNLHLQRLRPMQDARDGLIDLRSDMVYGAPDSYPWPVLADGSWHMPPTPLSALDKVYLSVFFNTTVQSYRTEPYAIALRPQGRILDGDHVLGSETTARGDQRMVSLAFHTSGPMARVYSGDGWTFTDPRLPADAGWVLDRDAFIKHALGLIGR